MKTYEEARAHAQRAANADGMDRGLEVLRLKGLPDNYHVFLLPERRNRCGHELRCEVVSCETLAKCVPGHGPEAPAHVPVEERLAIARGLGRMLDGLGVGYRRPE